MIKLKSPWTIIVPIIIILAIIIIILYFLAIPRLIDIEQHRPQIEKALEAYKLADNQAMVAFIKQNFSKY